MHTSTDAPATRRAPWAAMSVRALAVAGPIVMSVVACVIISSVLPPPMGAIRLVAWWLLLTTIAAVIAISTERLMRRLLPLAWLAEIATLFPDHTPPKFAAAMGSGSVTKLNERLDRARKTGESSAEQRGAEKLLDLIVALNTHDRRTRNHCERTRTYAVLIAEELGLPEVKREQVRWAALLHDVGKIAVDPALLNATEPLRSDELGAVRLHAEEGARLVAPLAPWLGDAVLAVGEHHEQWNGRGYPEGLAGEDISLAARIVAVADAFDMMTRPTYRRPAVPVTDARVELTRAASIQFDPAVVRAFLNISLGRLRLVMGPLAWVANAPVLAGASAPSVAGSAVAGLLLGVAALPGLTTPPRPSEAPPPSVVEVADPPEQDPDAPVTTAPQAPRPTVRAQNPGAPPPDRSEPPPSDPPPSDPPPSDPPPPVTPPAPRPPLGASNVALRLPEDSVIEFTLGEVGDAITVTAPPVGSIATVGGRRFAYTPAPDHHGTVRSGYERCTGGQCATAALTITIDPVNDPPTAGDTTALTAEDTPIIVNVLAQASDVDGDSLTVTGALAQAGGSATVTPTQRVRYTPAPDVSGTETVRYTLADGHGGTTTAVLTVTATPVNDPPSFTAGPDQTTPADAGPETDAGWATAIGPGPAEEAGQSVTFDVTADDPTLFTVQPAVAPNGDLTYTPALSGDGTTTITITAQDDGGTANGGNDTSSDQTADITITFVNQDPVAADDPDGSDDPNDFRTVLLADLFIPAAELLDNDTDPEFDPLTLATSGPIPTAEGSAECDATGCTYTPNGAYLGPDTFTYTMNDGNGGTDSATVTVDVTDYVVSPDRGDIVVNEVLYHGLTFFLETSDFIELHNPTAAALDISGWIVSDTNLVADAIDPGSGFAFEMPPGTVIPAGEYAVLWMGNDLSGVVPGFNDVPGGGVVEVYYGGAGNWLDEGGDDVTVYDADHQIVDHVAWGPTTAPYRGTPVPPSMGVWDAPPNNEVNLQPAPLGDSIALTPDGVFTADSDCWEINETNGATCPGALLTADTDTYTGRSTSVGRDNNTVVAEAGGPYVSVEGNGIVLDGSGSSGPTTSWNWDLDDDGQYDDASGVNPSVSWLTLGALGVDDDGAYPIGLEVNGGADSAATALTMDNLAPVLHTTGAATVSEGGVYTLNLAAIDPGDDTISGWTINWGDGTVEQVVGDPSSVTHTYAVGGFTYDILASASDEDGTYLQNELFVPSFDGDQVFRFDATTGGFLQAFATPDDPIEADMGPDGRLFVSGERSDNVRRHDAATGGFIEEFVAATDGGLDESEGLAWGPDGHLYVASYRTDEVLRYDGTTGAFIDVFASTGLDKPYDVVFGPDGNLYVNTYTANEVLRYDGTTGAFIDVFVAAGTGGLNTPEQMAFGPDGNLYVNSFGSDEVLRYNGTTGAFIDVFVAAGGAEDLDQPSGLAFGPDGHLYVGDHVDAVVLRYDGTTGTFIDEYVAPGSGGLTKPALLSFRPEQQVGVIAPVNQDPVAANDADGSDDPNDFRTVLLADLFIPAAELLDNDTDPEFEPLTVVPTGPTPTAEGSAQCDGTGCTYTPNGTYLGPDTFTYTISDGNGGTATATVTVDVTDYVVSPNRGDIVVNEVMHDGDTRLLLERSDFVELANPTASPVNVSGWMLSDNNLIVDDTDAGGGLEFVLPPGTVIPANDYAVVWMGSDRSGVDPGFTNVIGGGVLELYYGSWSNWLEESGDEVTIYDDRYQIVDHVAWGPDTAPDRNTPIPAGMGVWDTLPNNEVNLQATGQGTAIALTPDNTFTADSFCWEINESGAATCPGALPTVDTDTYGTRSTSVGRPNNAAGRAPARSKSPPGPHTRAARSAI